MNRLLKTKIILLLTLAAVSCTRTATFEKTQDGVHVHLNQATPSSPKLLKIQVVSENIIRVISSPLDSIPSNKSLVVLPTSSTPAFEVKENDDMLSVITSSIQAHVSLTSGQVSFTDKSGKTFLKEDTGGGTFEVSSHAVKQVFESEDDEAFYGLGQHQEGIMNYKGKDVSLFQYNTKVAIPFVVSSKNYGIYWDNYSLSKFGDHREYKSLAHLRLYNKEGKAGGLTGEYLYKADPSKAFVVREDSTIDYEFLSSLKNFPKEFKVNEGIVRWDGFIESDYAGIHKFLITYAGYAKIWIGEKMVADHWRQAWNPGTLRFHLDLEKGKKYPIKIEWNPDGGESYLSVKWLEADPKEQNKLSFYSEVGDCIDYYVIAGKDMDDVISGYRTLTGKAPIFPKWAMGLWQSRERYKTQDELLSVVAEFRKRKIPFDNIVLDWFYWKQDQWGSQQFDEERFPDPSGMIKKLHEQYNAHFMISVWPKFYEGVDTYNEFDKRGWLYKANIQNKQKDWVGPGYVSTFYDAFNPEARQAFWELIHQNLYTKGVDAWWLDASEPDILSNASIEHRKLLMNPTSAGPAEKYFNAYPLVNEMGIYEGQAKADPDKRIFILTRSAFAGSQRYAAATWSGDIAARWQDFKAQVPAGLNFSLSGIPYWTTDIGGFSVEKRFENAQGEDLQEWREQMTRWFQFGAFCPLFRVHGQYPYREMFNVAPENHVAYQTMLYYDKLRYQLMPYIYSLAGKTYFDNYTIMRALVMDFPNDKAVLNIGDEYMFGPNILVAPVTEYKARMWQVYLPASIGWYDFYTGKFYEGGQTVTVDAPLERIPLFVKEGSILPLGPDLQYATEKAADPITLYVFAGANGSFELYEDENINYNYTKGNYSTIPFQYNEETETLTIGERKGSFEGMLKERTFKIVWVKSDLSVGVGAPSHPVQTVRYSGNSIEVKQNSN
jgi:alpha-D-xyloside xylohydrolase